MAIIDSCNRKRGITYVYESFSYWDKELKQPRSRRRLLGRRDPLTGEIVPTRKASSPAVTLSASDNAADYATLYKRSQQIIRRKDDQIQRLHKELAEARHLLQKQNRGIARAMENLKGLEPSEEPLHA